MNARVSIAALGLAMVQGLGLHSPAVAEMDPRFEMFRMSSAEWRAIQVADVACRKHFGRSVNHDFLVDRSDGEFAVVCEDPKKTQTVVIETPDGPSEWHRAPGAPVFVIDLKTLKIVRREFSRD